MCNHPDSINFIGLIENGELLTLKDVVFKYNITEDILLTAVKHGDISKPLRRFGTFYYWSQEVDLLLFNQTIEDIEA